MEEFSAEICLREIRRLEKELKELRPLKNYKKEVEELRLFKENFLLDVAKYLFNDSKGREEQVLIRKYSAGLPLEREKLYKYIQKKEKEL